ncbi:MAG: rhodanese-like domain-containing protein [Methylococcales bacterium]
MTVQQLTVTALQAMLAQSEPLVLLDVREPREFDYAQITGSILIPLQQLPQRLNELDSTKAIAVICHHGMRSQQAAEYLVHTGFNQVLNVKGGIDAWSLDCDAGVPRY